MLKTFTVKNLFHETWSSLKSFSALSVRKYSAVYLMVTIPNNRFLCFISWGWGSFFFNVWHISYLCKKSSQFFFSSWNVGGIKATTSKRSYLWFNFSAPEDLWTINCDCSNIETAELNLILWRNLYLPALTVMLSRQRYLVMSSWCPRNVRPLISWSLPSRRTR